MSHPSTGEHRDKAAPAGKGRARLEILAGVLAALGVSCVTSESRFDEMPASAVPVSPLGCALSLALAMDAPWQPSRSETLAHVAARYADAGRFDRAFSIAEEIRDDAARAVAFADIAVVLARSGREEKSAEAFSSAVESARNGVLYRQLPLLEIARRYAELGQADRAMSLLEAVAADFGSAGLHVSEVVHMYDALLDAGEKDLRFLAKASHMVKAGASYDHVSVVGRERLLFGVLDAWSVFVRYIEAGEREKALEIAELDHFDKAPALLYLARREATRDEADKALRLVEEIDELCLRGHGYAAVAGCCTRLGRKREAAEAFAKALRIAEALDSAEEIASLAEGLGLPEILPGAAEKARLLSNIAEEYIDSGQEAKGLGILSEAAKVADTMKPTDERFDILASEANTFWRLGEEQKARECLAQALQSRASHGWLWARVFAAEGQYGNALAVARAMSSPDDRCRALVAVGDEFVKAGQPGKAIALLKEARSEVENEEVYAETLGELSGRYAKLGLFAEALRVVRILPDWAYESRARALADVGVEYAKAGAEPDGAAAGVLREIMGEFEESERRRRSQPEEHPP